MPASTPLTIDPDLEKAQEQYPARKKLNLWWDPTFENTVTEWKNGNQSRVLKYYVLMILGGIIIGLAIILPIRFLILEN